MNVCDALLDILAEYGVKYIFGVPGDSINELIDAIRKQDKIKFIHVMHEESGAFAASAQAKLTGELAVCAGTSGPGAIHLLNGLYDAKMDNAPVLAITGNVGTPYIGSGYQQEVNLLSLFEDVTVFNQGVFTAEQMPELAILACQAALSKNGVAHINIPSNISSKKVEDFKKKKQVIGDAVRMVPYKQDIMSAADLINTSKKICILAGIGARDGINEVVKLAELIKAPIIKALRGKDILPDEHPLTLGGIGLLGTEPALIAMRNCDLLIIIGSDFPYHDFYPHPGTPTIQIDKDVNQIGKRHVVTNALAGDARLTLLELLPSILSNENDSFLKECKENMLKWKKKQNEIETSTDSPIHPQALTHVISQYAKPDAIVCADTGTVTVWGARHFKIREGQRYTLSGDLASMAFGLPAAIGAQLKFPEKQIIGLCGDGGFAMLMCDFVTAVKYKLPIKLFIYNNSKLGLIQMEQRHSGNPESETDLWNPDYAEFAKICGGEGFTIRNSSELTSTVTKALHSDGPCIVNVFVNPNEITWPPEVSLEDAFNYSKAKIKEYLIRH
jgi:thiamine pyrophosphate-dependent acetolactate synthase large subunit-like protein